MPGTPTPPTLRSAFRSAATDFYYESIRVVPANVAWGICLLALLAGGVWGSPTLAIVVAPLLALPLVAIARLAAQTVRGMDVVLSDGVEAIRAQALPAIVAGIVLEIAAIVFALNMVAGATAGGPAGWAFATLAAWGLASTWVFGLAFWPLLADPARDDAPVIARVRLAGLVIVAEPARFAALGAAMAILTLVSSVAIVALLSVSVSFAMLVAARIVLPAADRFEAGIEAGRAVPGGTGPG